MKNYQIERVLHSSVYTSHSCCVVDYIKSTDTIGQINYCNSVFAKQMKTNNSVGMWKIKSLKPC